MPDPADVHVLVVEDEEDLASLVEFNLGVAGYRVSIARDGVEGLAAVRELAPDVVLLDVMMPRMDGWQVLRELKDDEAVAEIPVVMLTAMAEERDLIRGHLQGAVRYLTKPFEMRQLLEAVEDAVREPDEEERRQRRARVRELLQRLAELDSGREADGPQVSLSHLEHTPSPETRSAGPRPITDQDRARVASLTDRQRWLASQLAAGRGARELAEELDVSRSNVYATRKRVARKLGVAPDEVVDEARRLGL